MLELHSLESPFERIEEYLGTRGFFAAGGEDLVADLYLGYGLSDSLRRSGTEAPPEPCPLPLAACAVRPDGHAVAHNDNRSSKQEVRLGSWEPTWSSEEYAAAIEGVRAAIRRGDVYQVNLVQHLSAELDGSPSALTSRLRHLKRDNRALFVGNDWGIASASPELFLARRGRRVWTEPIKGTRPLGRAAELRQSAKDAAEHVMIVDLERNDLSRVCEPGTVRWPELMAVRPLAGVEHMVSTVEGTLREGVGLAELLAATFPGGSVTGAPKIAAIEHIAELEPVGRGASMGALGTVRGNGDIDLTLTIRTFAWSAGRLHLWVGGGIVWDSDPVGEIRESWLKAAPLLAALDSELPASAAGLVRSGAPAR